MCVSDFCNDYSVVYEASIKHCKKEGELDYSASVDDFKNVCDYTLMTEFRYS